jgi:ActD protein
MGIVAAYRELDATVDAIEDLKKQKITDFVVYTPTPRHEIEEAVDPPTSPVRRFTLIGGFCGACFGYWIAIWTSDYWPLVVGGKAVASWIPYTIIGFELMVLVGALSTVAGMFINSRVPKITLTVGFDPRFTSGHFGIWVPAAADRARVVEETLRRHGAEEVRRED